MPGSLYLAIDYGQPNPTDNGTRPYTGAQPTWNNASLFLDPPRPTQTQAEVDQPSTIKVRVSNKGAAPVTNVRVRAYVMNPHVGITRPSQAIATFLSEPKSVAPGQGGSAATDSHVFDCLANNLPWKPTQAQLDANTDDPGHLCLVANCFQDSNLADPPLEGSDLGANDPFQVLSDQHQGQRNIMLVPAGGMKNIGFFVNPAPEAQETTLSVNKLLSVQAQGPSERLLLLTSGSISAQRTASGHRRLVFTDADGNDVAMRFSRFKLNFGLQVGAERHPQQLRMAAAAEPVHASLNLDVNPKEPVGSIHAFDIVQRDQQGRPIGSGLRVLTVVTG